jgi:hypothetical protein
VQAALRRLYKSQSLVFTSEDSVIGNVILVKKIFRQRDLQNFHESNKAKMTQIAFYCKSVRTSEQLEIAENFRRDE